MNTKYFMAQGVPLKYESCNKMSVGNTSQVHWSTKICLSSLHLSSVFGKKLMEKSIFVKIHFTLMKQYYQRKFLMCIKIRMSLKQNTWESRIGFTLLGGKKEKAFSSPYSNILLLQDLNWMFSKVQSHQ